MMICKRVCARMNATNRNSAACRRRYLRQEDEGDDCKIISNTENVHREVIVRIFTVVPELGDIERNKVMLILKLKECSSSHIMSCGKQGHRSVSARKFSNM